MTTTPCPKCHGTGVRRHAFYTDGKACDCGWQHGGELRTAADAEFHAEQEAQNSARLARRRARTNERNHA